MSGFLIFYIVSAIAALIMLAIGSWWDMKKDPQETITLGNLFMGMFLTFCPIVNTICAVFIFIWFLSEVAPKIVLFGPKRTQ